MAVDLYMGNGYGPVGAFRLPNGTVCICKNIQILQEGSLPVLQPVLDHLLATVTSSCIVFCTRINWKTIVTLLSFELGM